MDQSTLAERVGLSKSTMSRILSGVQEPKLSLAFDLARALGVTVDYLMADEPDATAAGQTVVVNDDELMILKIVRRLGVDEAIDRLLGVASGDAGAGTGGVAEEAERGNHG